VFLFDSHRVGRHEYLFDAHHRDGRRCLAKFEMRRRGWATNARGRWHDPAGTAKARDSFQKASLSFN
jgi:hypothetical protein